MDGQRTNKIPAITYNQMVHPLLPMAIKGVIWYQGESNANSDAQGRAHPDQFRPMIHNRCGDAQGRAYRDQFRTMITSWRQAFNGGKRGDFPFLWVQLPGYTRPDSVPSP